MSEMEFCILTATGRRLDFIDPRPEMIDLEDIATGLAASSRFAGQLPGHLRLTVAEHSLGVCDVLANLGPRERLAALLHDAAEAYMGDVPTPLKRLVRAFKVYEGRLLEAIYERFDCAPSDEVARLIAMADRRRLLQEGYSYALWEHRLPPGDDFNAADWRGLELPPPMTRIAAKTRFWTRAYVLAKQIERLKSRPSPADR